MTQAGWTPLFEATRWIAKTYPEQTPKRYGCGSWRHVIHESQQFAIRKQSQAKILALRWFGIAVVRGKPPRNRSKQ
ncbi:OST-HTH/LOTUS domain-containing protein [Pseudomonas helleri]|uniref:OST-HTH/LOTUS domain-containing protein n=1 Tax=Pseudomonas helleri TaxID=1608996 RepID=UPI001E4AA15F|nr:OST-HTH/LOTUS domain-containing protein [Pseudomonas helleri]